MKNLKKFLSLLLCVVMIVCMFSVLFITEIFAAETNTTQTSAVTNADSFSWDNATVYFLLTDRFENGNKSNDHSYNRLIDRDGSIVTNDKLNSDVATFHGGDFKGITNKIKEGYFDNLGVNALWISAPYEQIHGYVIVNQGKSNSVKHYAYHGYYAMDYTQTDANFGTAAEFKEMVDTAHDHNIRIVLDVVMNHPGYNTIYDMKEYNYGGFIAGYGDDYALEQYYNWKFNGYYHTSIDYNSSSATQGWANWWGPNWIRAGLSGHTPVGSDSLTGSAGGDLPDFKTESTASVSVPTFLQNKWKQEGRYDAEMAGLNSWFSKNGKSKTVRNHLVYWLSEWVREYGVDGFRCDTAKHVELDAWKALSDECTKALKEWRTNNKGKTNAATWTDDFWMTAEDYGSGVNKDDYFTKGAFDSKINFSFTGGGGVPNSGSINNTYSDYANKINSDPNFNVLTYISSHDTALCRDDLIYQGSAFLLMPGAVQIFYGDETARPLVSSSIGNVKDHLLRSDMNWNSMDKNVLSHWQKVGTFRNNHIAVGAGTHKGITTTNGVGFVRQYNNNGVSDTVFAVIAANKNSNVTLTVGSYVPDGTLLKNTYDDKNATVSGGKVTFNSGINGTILLEIAGASKKPDVTVSHTGGDFTDTLSITATLNEYATSGTYTIGNSAAVSFTDSKTFTIGKDMAFDESVTIKFTATDGTDTKTYSYTYTKVDPNASPFKFPTERTTYLLDKARWGNANCYAWITNGSENASWPGITMTKVGIYEGYDVYSYEVPSNMDNVIFNNADGTQTDDLKFAAYSYFDNSSKQWVKVTTPTPQPTQKPTQKPSISTTIILGDVDRDEKITVLDATLIQRHIAKLIVLTEDAKLAAEVDSDSTISVLDATSIQRYLAKLEVNYPIGEQIKTDSPDTPTQSPEPTQAPEPTQEPTTKPDDKDTNTIYVDMGKQCTACAYYWIDGSEGPFTWPGLTMQSVSSNIYKIEIPKEFNRVIFSDNASDQTGDLEIPGDNYIYNKSSGKWAVYNENGNTNNGFDFSNPRTIVVLDDGNWGNITIHYWNDSSGTIWPGDKMTSIGQVNGANAYAFTLEDQFSNFVINNGNNGIQSDNLFVSNAYLAYRTSTKQFVDASSYLK